MAFLLQHLLSESAARNPDALAVRFQSEALTYGELDAKSNQLAHALIEAGVAPGDRVGIHLDKSLASILSVFGILKAGGCYVPVDVNSPAPRLGGIIRQCAMRCLITSVAAGAKLADCSDQLPLECIFFADHLPSPPLPFATRCCTFSQALTGPKAEPLARGGTDQDLAYILFTSGSTGVPKGVMLSHLNALTFVNWGSETFALTAQDRLSNHAPLSFDLSVFDIFAGIKAGAAISLIPPGLALFPIRLAELIEDHRISVWYSVPSVLTLLLTHGKLEDRNLRDLRLILFAGEVFPVKFLRTLMQAVPHARHFNLYGPTETNVCTYYEVKSIPPPEASSIPIGKACANTEVFALDEEGRKVTAPGREGLLYARGSTVMQGYYGRPRETEAAFIKNPFTPGREEKIYCTGDWVTLEADGNYHYVGRKDHMVKTRGYRVELGEIESALYAHPGVREAAAVALPDELLGNKIKAFVVAENSSSLDEQEVQRHCARMLPRYMVPEEVEFRASLPRTTSDKIDRPRLRAESMKSSG